MKKRVLISLILTLAILSALLAGCSKEAPKPHPAEPDYVKDAGDHKHNICVAFDLGEPYRESDPYKDLPGEEYQKKIKEFMTQGSPYNYGEYLIYKNDEIVARFYFEGSFLYQQIEARVKSGDADQQNYKSLGEGSNDVYDYIHYYFEANDPQWNSCFYFGNLKEVKKAFVLVGASKEEVEAVYQSMSIWIADQS
jgi:hypothetical protein